MQNESYPRRNERKKTYRRGARQAGRSTCALVAGAYAESFNTSLIVQAYLKKLYRLHLMMSSSLNIPR